MAYTQPLITSDAGSFSPLLRYSASESIESRNVIHELIGGGVAVTFGGSPLATSNLEMVFTSEASCLDAYDQLINGHLFELTDYSKTSTSMFFVVSGNIQREFIIESTDTWTITVDIQQVEP
jgi:hypothetical protein